MTRETRRHAALVSATLGLACVLASGASFAGAQTAAPSATPVATPTVPEVMMTPVEVPGVESSPSGTPVPIVLPSADPLVVPGAGFKQIRKDAGLTGAWLKIVDGRTHAVFVASTSDPAFATISTDLDLYIPRIVRQIESDRSTTIVSKGKKTICHGTKAGYVIRARTTIGKQPVIEYVLFGVSGTTVTMAAYDRDASAPSLPEAVGFVESLCPP